MANGLASYLQPPRADARPDWTWLDQARAEGQAGQVGAAAAAGLVPDPVQVRADGADADVQLRGDLGVGAALGDQGDQLAFPGTELCRARRGRLRRPGI